jgi:competence protein ComEC
MTQSSTVHPVLTILDVGHGNCAVLKDENGVVVIDAGANNSLMEYLLMENIREVDTVLLSHADHDHINGLTALLVSQQFRIRRVRVNSDAEKTSRSWRGLTLQLSQQHDEGTVDFQPALVADMRGTYDVGQVGIQIVAPSSFLAAHGPGSMDRRGKTITSNSHSAVIRLVYRGEGAVVFAGDLDEIGLYDLTERFSGEELRAKVLVFPHHGGRSGMASETFARRVMDIVRPEMIVFSIGRGRFGNPQPSVVAAVRAVNPNVWIACTQLSLQCSGELLVPGPQHLLRSLPLRRPPLPCCAGNIEVRFGPQLEVRPIRSDHGAFVSRVGIAALCRRPLPPNP